MNLTQNKPNSNILLKVRWQIGEEIRREHQKGSTFQIPLGLSGVRSDPFKRLSFLLSIPYPKKSMCIPFLIYILSSWRIRERTSRIRTMAFTFFFLLLSLNFFFLDGSVGTEITPSLLSHLHVWLYYNK